LLTHRLNRFVSVQSLNSTRKSSWQLPEEEPKDQQKKEQPRPWTPEEVINVLKAFEPIIDKVSDKWLKEIIAYLKTKDKNTKELNRLSSRHDLKLIRYSLLFLAGITAVLSYLAYLKVVSSDAVLYAFGALTGSVLTLMVKFRFWAFEPAEEEGEA